MDWNKFYFMKPMKYYDAGSNINGTKAQDIINNKDNNYIATQKSDGEWCRIIIGDDGRIVAQSRNISTVTGEYGDKTEHIPHIIDDMRNFPKGTVFIGELCFPEIKSTARDVGTILRCLPAKAIDRQKNHKLIFRVFDCLSYNNIDLMNSNFNLRFQVVIDQIKKGNRILKYTECCNYTLENFDDFLASILANGGEGIVIHSKEYLYQPGGRPAWKTLKVKKTTGDIEVAVVSTIEPKKNYEGQEADSWKYSIDGQLVTKPYYMGWKNGIVINHNGNLVNVTSGLTDDDRAWLATKDAEKLITENKLMAVISGMEITSDSIRHPRLIRLRSDL